MAQFYDDFERANGAPGNGWVAGTGTHSISGGSLVGSNLFSALNTNIASSGRLEARAHIYQNNYQGTHGGPVVKGRAGSDEGFCLTVYGTTAPFALRIVNTSVPSGSVLKSYTLPGNPPPYYELALVWEMGHLSGYFNGALVIEADSGTWATNTLAGVSGSSSYAAAADVTLIGGAVPTMSVDPAVIPNFGACSPVTITGTEGTWTPGTPGAPIFTVNHGTISAQTVTDAYHVTLTYCPGDYLGSVCFTDPTTGTQVCTIVSSDPNIAGGGGGQLAPEDVAYIHRSAIAQAEPHILNAETPTGDGLPNDEAIQRLHDAWRFLRALVGIFDEPPEGLDYVRLIWQILNAQQLPDVDHNILGEATQANINAGLAVLGIAGLKTDNYQTLYDVAQAVRYGPGATIENLFTVLGITDTGPYASIIDALTQLHNDDLTNYIDLVARLQAIRGEGMHDLDDILVALDNLSPSVDLSPIMAKLNDMQGSGLTKWSLNEIYSVSNGALGAISDYVAKAGEPANSGQYNVNDVIALIRGASDRTITEVYNRIGDFGGGTGTDITPVLTLLAAIRGDPNVTLKQILDKIGPSIADTSWTLPALLGLLLLIFLGLGAPEAIAISAGGLGAAGLIALIVESLGDVSEIIGKVWNWWASASQWRAVPSVPSFPGNDRVQWGEIAPFEDAIRLPGLMDGAVIRISTPGKAPYAIRETLVTRYSRLGTFAFQSEETSYEHIQPIQFLEQLATPKAMNQAIAILVQCKPGTVGTVIPYTLTYPGPWPFAGIKIPL